MMIAPTLEIVKPARTTIIVVGVILPSILRFVRMGTKQDPRTWTVARDLSGIMKLALLLVITETVACASRIRIAVGVLFP